MAKKKNKKQKQVQTKISDAAYMRSGRARKLPIHECLVSSDWEVSGLAHIVVSRRHVNGNISLASYLVDLYCLGVKDAWYRVNVFSFEYQEFLDKLEENLKVEQAEYATAHNIIYGAIAFAEDYGFSPVSDFREAKMMLEEDTEEIPLIEFEFGVDGKPQLVVTSDNSKLPFYISKLEKHAGKGNFEVVFLKDPDDDSNNYDDYDAYDDYEDYNDEDDAEEEEYVKLTTYTENDWEEFIQETHLDDLVLRRWESFYIFEKTIAGQELSDPEFNVQNIPITYEPIPGTETEEEGTEMQEIYEDLNFKENSTEDLRQILSRVYDAIEKWPENPIFHNYLINVYRNLKDEKKEKEAVRNLVNIFPEYLFGKLSYAELLIGEGKIDEVPNVFDKQLHLSLAFPKRDVFHISELISFNTLMCLYYMNRNDLTAAYGYRKMLSELEIPSHLNENAELFFKIDISVIMEVRDVVSEAKRNKNKREKLIAALVA